MESNNNNNNFGHGEQQLRKRKFNELTNDGQPAAAGEEQKQQQPPAESLSKKKYEQQQGNDDLEFESLSREDLVNLVRKLLASQNEPQKQLETTKTEAEHSSSRQAEEFSQRIVQLEQEKAEVHAELGKKVAEIVEKSEELAEKAKEIDALLIQLKESSHSHQIALPTEQQQEQMKIQLSLETWFDWLEFVPRHQLGKIVPEISSRKFGSIVQKFLHEYGEITIDHIEIVAPYEEDPSGPRPRVRVWKWKDCRPPLRFEMVDAQMPANIKNFDTFKLSYFNQSVRNFMLKFQQKGLLHNVNLFIDTSSKHIVQPVLCHLLPLINGIATVDLADSVQLVDIYDAANSKQIYEMNMKMMEKTRFLSVDYDHKNLHANVIDLYCRWLYQPARADGKSRVLFLGRFHADSAPISLFIDRIKQDFLMATNPVTFFIRINLPKASFQPEEEHIFILRNHKNEIDDQNGRSKSARLGSTGRSRAADFTLSTWVYKEMD